MTYQTTLILLIISLILLLSVMYVTIRASKKSQIQKIIITMIMLLINWCVVTIAEEITRNTYGYTNMLCVNLIYISVCFLPIFILFFGLAFAKTKVNFRGKYLLLFIIPIITTLIIWTNSRHHWFFNNYSVYSEEATYGWYYFFHSVYSYGLIFIGLYTLLSYSIKNTGLFSIQSGLMILGISVPAVINIIYSFNLFSLTFSINPIAFTISGVCITVAVQKFKLLNIIPIAIQKVVDCMPDSYFVVNTHLELIDYNKSFAHKIMPNIKLIKSELILDRMKEIILKEEDYDILHEKIINVIKTNKSCSFEQEIEDLVKVFSIDITPITTDGAIIGAIALFKDITELNKAQNILVEQERLASLGQLAGGMAHDINTPIATVRLGLKFFENRYPYTEQELKMFNAMKISSDNITEIVESVRNQIRNTGQTQNEEFTISKVFDSIKVLLNNELEKNKCALIINNKDEIHLNGDFSKLMQILMNIITNSIQAYENKGGNIDVRTYKNNNFATIEIEDKAGGISDKIASGIFKQILTTKGTKGTGFGLYFSQSMLKANFNGDISFKTEEGLGSIFYIKIPIEEEAK